jgi:hypothetical protein
VEEATEKVPAPIGDRHALQGNRINRQKRQPDAQTSIFWQRRTEKHSRLSFQT